MKISGVPFRGLTLFVALIVISGFYTTTSFPLLDSPLLYSEELGFVPVSVIEELGIGDFCVQFLGYRSCEEAPSFNNPEELLSALTPEQNPPFTLKEAVAECRHLNYTFAELIEGTGTEFDLITKRQRNTLNSYKWVAFVFVIARL